MRHGSGHPGARSRRLASRFRRDAVKVYGRGLGVYTNDSRAPSREFIDSRATASFARRSALSSLLPLLAYRRLGVMSTGLLREIQWCYSRGKVCLYDRRMYGEKKYFPPSPRHTLYSLSSREIEKLEGQPVSSWFGDCWRDVCCLHYRVSRWCNLLVFRISSHSWKHFLSFIFKIFSPF